MVKYPEGISTITDLSYQIEDVMVNVHSFNASTQPQFDYQNAQFTEYDVRRGPYLFKETLQGRHNPLIKMRFM